MNPVNSFSIKKTAFLGLCTTLALIMGYVEYLIPFRFPVPGVKLGLPNIVILFLLYTYGINEALIVAFIRIVLQGFLFGNIFGIFYSLTGMLFSLPVMNLMKKSRMFSMTGVSAAGGALFNAGQILAASIAALSPALIRYLPILLIAGELSGVIIGIIDTIVFNRIRGNGSF